MSPHPAPASAVASLSLSLPLSDSCSSASGTPQVEESAPAESNNGISPALPERLHALSTTPTFLLPTAGPSFVAAVTATDIAGYFQTIATADAPASAPIAPDTGDKVSVVTVDEDGDSLQSTPTSAATSNAGCPVPGSTSEPSAYPSQDSNSVCSDDDTIATEHHFDPEGPDHL